MHKHPVKWFHLGLAASLVLASCDNKQSDKSSSGSSSSANGTASQNNAQQEQELLAKRVAAFGFMAHLPKNTAMVLGVYQPEKKLRSTGLVEMSQKLLTQGQQLSSEIMKAKQDKAPLDVAPPPNFAPDPDDLTAVTKAANACQMAERAPAQPEGLNNAAAMQQSAQSVLLRILPYVSNEIVLACGNSIATGYEVLFELLDRSNRQTYTRMLEAALQDDQVSDNSQEQIKELADTLYTLIKNSGSLNVSIASKVEQAQIDEFKKAASELGQAAAGMWQAKQSTHQSGGFSGELVSLDLQKIAKMIIDGYKNQQAGQQSVQGLPQGVDEAKLLDSLQGKQLHVWFASNDDHVLVMTGGDLSELQLAEKPQDSLLAGPDFDFADKLLATGSTPMMVGYTSNELSQKAYAISKKYSMGSYCELAKNLLARQIVKEKLGDAAALIAQLERTEQSAQKLYENTEVGASNFFIDCNSQGINIELDTGSKGMPFYNQPLKYANLAQSNNVIFFGNYLVGKQHQINSNNFIDNYGKSLFEAAKLYASAQNIDNKSFSAGFGEFDSNYREPLSIIWQNFLKMSGEGFGEEVAVLVDNNGVMPNFPMIPKEISKNNIPGIVTISEIKDRKVVAESWDGIWQQVNNIYLKATASLPPNTLMSELPSPTLLPNGEYTTAFFQLPLFDQRFTPNLCISDKCLVYANNFERSSGMQTELKSLPVSEQKLAYMRFNPQALNVLLQQYKPVFKEYNTAFDMSNTLCSYLKDVVGSTAISSKGSLKLILTVKTSGVQK